MEIRKSSGLLGCTLLLTLALLSGCGNSTSNTTIPTATTIFNAHSLIFKNSSTVVGMGYNGFGQLGAGAGDLTSRSAATAAVIGPMNGASAGGVHSLAFSFSNLSSVYAWGSNYHGQIGSSVVTTGTAAYSGAPVKVPLHSVVPGAPGVVTSVSAGGFHSLAAMDGTVFSWGGNGSGQLGHRVIGELQLQDSAVPTQVLDAGNALLGHVVKVAAGGYHSLALTDDGRIYAWGDNTYGQLGSNPAIGLYSSTPTLVQKDGATFTGVVEIVAAGNNSYARTADGKVWAWGYNLMGQLGRDPAGAAATLTTPAVDPLPFSFNPREVVLKKADASIGTALQIAAGLDHVLALMDDGSIQAWGFNEYGQLGDTSVVSRATPVTVRIDGVLGHPLLGVTSIAAFGNSSLARVESRPGVWFGWGDNGFGQLGSAVANNAISKVFIPLAVQGL
jgi:alpha-tubulin suppressor-like RCC1 family protein